MVGYSPLQIFARTLRGIGFEDGNGATASIVGDTGTQDTALGLLCLQATAIQANDAAVMVQIGIGWGFHADVAWFDNGGDLDKQGSGRYNSLAEYLAHPYLIDPLTNYNMSDDEAWAILESHTKISRATLRPDAIEALLEVFNVA